MSDRLYLMPIGLSASPQSEGGDAVRLAAHRRHRPDREHHSGGRRQRAHRPHGRTRDRPPPPDLGESLRQVGAAGRAVEADRRSDIFAFGAVLSLAVPRDCRVELRVVSASLMVGGLLVTFIGSFFRGPGWNWVWPWDGLFFNL